MEIIDGHTNLRFPGERLPDDDTLWPTFEERLAVLREAGVSRALACRNESVRGRTYDDLLIRNRQIAAACEASEGMLIPSAIVQPALGVQACDLLRRCREELGMRFVGEMFDRWLGYEWGTPEYHRVLECAVSLRMVPLIHCDDSVLKELGERHPSGKFLIAHLMDTKNGPDHRIEALRPYPNLSLVTSGHEIARAGAIRKAVRSLGADRVVFGSDLGAVDPVIAVRCVQRSGLSESEQAFVFSGNFRALWRWTESH